MRYAALVLAALGLASCRYFEDDAQFGYSRTGLTIPSAFTTADVRIITQRYNPQTGRDVVCTEPSPDVAKAISTAFSASGSGGNGTATGNVAFSGANAEAVAELAGRSTALLGLRDGLYRACEAYANGVIGSDTYALIVSRYGQLMTTLFLGQDIADAARAQASAQASIQANSTPGQSSQTPSNTQQQNSPSGSPSQTPSNTQAQNSPSGSPSQTPPPATSPPASTTPPPSSTPTAVPSSNAAAALVRMNEDYLNLDLTNLLHTLSVVCINRWDPTRAGLLDTVQAGDPRIKNDPNMRKDSNWWLDQTCPKIASAIGLQATDPKTALSIVAGLLAPPVNPMVATPTAAQNKATSPPKTAAPTCVTMSPDQIKMIAGDLGSTVADPTKPTATELGTLATDIKSFEGKQSPPIPDLKCANGQIDTATLAAFQGELKAAPATKPKK